MKRYTPLFYYLALANFLFFLSNSMYVLLPVFLKSLGASESYIGVVSNADKLVMIIVTLGFGSLMYGRDKLKLLRIGYVILVIVFSGYIFISSLSWLILIIRIVHGIGLTLSIIICSTMVFDIVPIEDAAEAIGIYGITGVLSYAISPFAGEVLLSYGYSFQIIFAISAILIFISLCITYIMPRPEKVKESNKTKSKGSLYLLKNPQFTLIIITMLILGGGFGVIFTYLPNFIKSTTNFKFSYFFVSYIIVIITTRLTALQISNRFNKYKILIVLFLVGAIANIFLNFLFSITILILASILSGVSYSILYPMLNAMAVSMTEGRERDKANALFTGFFNGGMMIFSLSLGFLIDYFHTYLAAFNVCAAFYIAGIIPIIIMILKLENKTIEG